MMRGAIVIITALMAFIFLGRKQYLHHILSLIVIVIGVAVVGVASTHSSGSDDKTTAIGIGLIVFA
jgi:drug/metabolite transporter (DMT)-like permease